MFACKLISVQIKALLNYRSFIVCWNLLSLISGKFRIQFVFLKRYVASYPTSHWLMAKASFNCCFGLELYDFLALVEVLYVLVIISLVA